MKSKARKSSEERLESFRRAFLYYAQRVGAVEVLLTYQLLGAVEVALTCQAWHLGEVELALTYQARLDVPSPALGRG